ncbi:MAG: RecX family transcriptional regulator [Sphingobacteriia bacterium]|nr:RecX family transcriptional regulator [Sphingobacteriia bacterium]
MALQQKLTPQQALQKLRHYCAYQERSHAEVTEKLYNFGLRKTDVAILLSQLIEDDYVNEERFATQFAGGKFRIKQWGKVKIEYELRQKKVSPRNIKKALASIDEEMYTKTLHELTIKKWRSLKNEQYLNRMAKTTNYMLQKGFERNEIITAINSLRNQA